MLTKAEQNAVIDEFARVLGVRKEEYVIRDIETMGCSANGAVSVGSYSLEIRHGREVLIPKNINFYIDWRNHVWEEAIKTPLRTIAHEFQHVMQLMDQTLIVISDYRGYFFNGEYWSAFTSYWDSPWEVEARSKEKQYTELFLDEADPLIVKMLLKEDNYYLHSNA